MRAREWHIWLAAAALSLLLHLLLLLDSGSRAGAQQATPQSTTRVSFRSVAAPLTAPQAAPQNEVSKPPEPEVVEAPAPPPSPRPKKENRVAETVRQPEPSEAVPQPELMPAPPPTTESAEKASLPAQQAYGAVQDPALLEKAKHEYLRRLMAHIESHKHYPRMARRRGIEGEVVVRFQLLEGGAIADVTIEQGHRILRQAVKEAMHAAQPLPIPPKELALPLPISFSVQFYLNRG